MARRSGLWASKHQCLDSDGVPVLALCVHVRIRAGLRTVRAWGAVVSCGRVDSCSHLYRKPPTNKPSVRVFLSQNRGAAAVLHRSYADFEWVTGARARSRLLLLSRLSARAGGYPLSH